MSIHVDELRLLEAEAVHIIREVVAELPMEQNGFEHVLEVAARLARAGRRFAEVHVTFSPRATGVSKMSHLSETIKYMYHLGRYALTLDRGGR